MIGHPRRSGDSNPDSLDEAKAIYCRSLRRNASAHTFYSHQNAVRKFCDWTTNQQNNPAPPAERLALFIEHLLNDQDLSINTVIGYVYSLLNFFSYYFKESPDILRIRFAAEIPSIISSRDSMKTLLEEFETTTTTERRRSVNNLRAYLRQRQYGTRTHVYVEFIYQTAGSPAEIRDLNLPDLENANSIASIGVPEKHIVSTTGLHQERPADLPQELIDPLDVYLEHERDTVSRDNEQQPLFTTSHGRASSATLRRAVKSASNEAREYAARSGKTNRCNQRSPSSATPVVPSDIRNVALSQVVESQ